VFFTAAPWPENRAPRRSSFFLIFGTPKLKTKSTGRYENSLRTHLGPFLGSGRSRGDEWREVADGGTLDKFGIGERAVERDRE
jgi:hypothetical protein